MHIIEWTDEEVRILPVDWDWQLDEVWELRHNLGAEQINLENKTTLNFSNQWFAVG